MPTDRTFNSKLPRSSSSISLNESATDINYDSDISEDDNAIAEDGDDEDDDYVDSGDAEEFEVEINTLTGNTFSVMIHPTDTVEVLKTRIAFQEGISPADQNLLMEQGKLLDNANGNTIEELNIARHSKLTLVTNLSSGTGKRDDEGGINLAPIIKRNYHNFTNHNNYHVKQQSSSSSTSSFRLPKITPGNSNAFSDSKIEKGSAMHPDNSTKPTLKRLDEREWMQSLFNKVVQEDEKEVIDMDSTRTTAIAADGQPEISRPTRYKRNSKFTQRPEEDGNLLIVQGDDGVILIIQKNSGELLDNTLKENVADGSEPRENGKRRSEGGFDLEFYNGKISTAMASTRRHQYSKVHEKIKENAITLEKMKVVRGMLAQQKQKQRQDTLPPRPAAPLKSLEFPKILKRDDLVMSSSSGTVTDLHNGSERKAFNMSTGAIGTRSINSSKMSLNRLVAEIYLQSKRKGHAFQPGQPPYTELQLVRYVQLKLAILLEEQRTNKTEPCFKCASHGEWLYEKATPQLIPTVVMDRLNRIRNGRQWKSMEPSGMMEEKDDRVRPVDITRRKSLIPIKSSYKSLLGESHLSSVANAPEAKASNKSSKVNASTSNNTQLVQAPSLRARQKFLPGAANGTRKAQSRPGTSAKSVAAKKGAVRCQACKKKIGIACRYMCRCGLTFCSVHRYPEAHECTFDYKAEGRNKIRENNPVIVAPKIQEI